MRDAKSNHLWVNIYILERDITRFNIKSKTVLDKSGIGHKFKEVKNKYEDKDYTSNDIICLEQKKPVEYAERPIDKIDSVILDNIDSIIDDLCLKEKVWQVATSIPPYRKYYLYLRPQGDKPPIAQLPALYALFFYFSSVTRYRPSEFDKMRNSEDYRAFISDFFASQPEQFLNLFASEFCKRKVVKPAIP